MPRRKSSLRKRLILGAIGLAAAGFCHWGVVATEQAGGGFELRDWVLAGALGGAVAASMWWLDGRKPRRRSHRLPSGWSTLKVKALALVVFAVLVPVFGDRWFPLLLATGEGFFLMGAGIAIVNPAIPRRQRLPEPVFREASPLEQSLVAHLLSGFDADDELKAQIRGLRVSGDAQSGLEFKVRAGAPRSAVPDGPIPVWSMAYGDDDTFLGNLDLVVQDGYLEALEVTWEDGALPSELPSPERVVLD